MAKAIRVYPDRNVWVVKKDGAYRASAITDTKSEALEVARDIALNQDLDIIIHGKNGKIQKRVRPQDSSDSDCFITTACVKYFKLGDRCYELTTLRSFRDNYLSSSPKDKKLVSDYYVIAPQIVSLLESDRNKEVLFKKILNDIRKACIAIDCCEFEKAKAIYKRRIIHLINHFKLL